MGEQLQEPPSQRRTPIAPLPPGRLAQILDIAEDGIITVNERQEIVLFNRRAAKIFGYDPLDVLGKSLDILIPTASRGVHRGQVEKFANGPVVSRTMGERRTIAGRRKDGTEFPVEITISKLESDEGLFLTAIVRDAEDRKKYEDALLRLNQELEERVRMRTAELAERNLQLTQKTEENETFVYSVSHDLRSPLVNMEGFSEELQATIRELEQLLDDKRIPPDLRGKVRELFQEDVSVSVGFIRNAVGRLSGIIDALLRLSRAGRVVYQPRNLNVVEIARRVVDSLHMTAEKKQAEVIVGELPPAWGDPVVVEQV
ncbi:MAG TPA: PAS domain S-box protein, partial [Gemmata sp.]|nr:PAS domain S-box protein [Gemmata sp.]